MKKIRILLLFVVGVSATARPARSGEVKIN